ncbi:restriction endonuclease subunit S [Limosilactobacillus fermentum]|uniref:Restriction endonuclease subunit S n=1 Tax=Limosilactobacillus fermentum TaxID=1613 RepID=A0AAJ6D2W6_LIMFE|nr:restriction endonuclease subunit S [Limosilactobacillus fermentum]MBE4710630.1 hypothetical protein [Limosilactobacillus fermentum]MCT2918330.1 hypothetical protein [Limosilactobacillus fermentum]MCT3437364.1 hypothetical protein [Limosilactobacillus fermentum]MED7635821.1 hypothetical protein [Limosilactobacillus fermentum]PTV34826.1 hypothetical protein DB329_09715 [Limosilactobacillus fermentum]
MGSLFSFSKGDVDVQNKHIDGKGEFFVNSGVTNRGIKGKTDYPAKIFPAGTITIDFFGNAFYRNYRYKLATHNHVFSLTGECLKNDSIGPYLIGAMAYLPKKYAFSNMATVPSLEREEIMLPTQEDGTIDFDLMTRFITAIEKLVIEDVVDWADKKIAATKQVTNIE